MNSKSPSPSGSSSSNPNVPTSPHSPSNDAVLAMEPSGNFLQDIHIYFLQLQRAYNKRYELWEDTNQEILKILRKMQQNMQQNISVFIQSLEKIHKRLDDGLDDFTRKRDEIQRYSDVDYKQVVKELRETLLLLGIQIQDFKLRKTINELYDIYLE
jgi:exonuclease VII large subunit